MPRRLLYVLTFASAVICVLSLGLVVRSFFRLDAVVIPVGESVVGAFTIDARLCLWKRAHPGRDFFFYPYPRSAFINYGTYRDWDAAKRARWLNLGWNFTTIEKNVFLPLWLVPIVSAILPVRWWRRHRSHSRTRAFAVVDAPAEQM
jgi:hypothetical protein